MKLPESYYHNTDTVAISRDLIGKYLFTYIDGELAGGYIVETEAYTGVNDKAAHSYGGKLTPRTQTMYMQGGVSYVYLGISRKINAMSLQSDVIWVEDRGLTFPDSEVAAGPRVGVDYAGEDALLPYRFYVKGNIYVSKPNK
ncbi:DNA-3-methyladenine glycosylase [Mucilaginibacter rigui]|uniref:DNA-3-methyladenine glycosylase n=1 Tax=Mucilaginibacter rigui TaxID=534635 RepID=A0ABR7X2S9_9SPHI|nr:DNA-3-methyladenine glycosylase [Mucilaginibacter rigui]MBD1384876.1 DNA-3-methyladenine glycosylase [Mucilaginibacter rigui]